MHLLNGLGIALFLLSAVGLGAQTPTGPVYVVTHIDITPNYAEAAKKLLTEFAAATRTDDALIRYDLLQQDSRANHFVAVEVWESRDAYEAHGGHPHSIAFREKLQPMLGSPFDVRLHSAIE